MRTRLIVKGVDLLGDELAEPGWIILTTDSLPGATEHEARSQVTAALGLP